MIQRTLLLTAALLFSSFASAEQTEFSDGDPRNTQTSVGFGFDDDGKYNLAFSGGIQNLYGDGSYQTQTNARVEYFDDPRQERIRAAHFDGRFGGIYLDISMQDVMDLYTIGYMLPVKIPNTKIMLFPSINYTRSAIDTDEAADKIADNFGGSVTIQGADYNVNDIARVLENIILEGDDTSDLATFNLYAMMPWTKEQFSTLQFLTGSSYSGYDMDLVSIFALYGHKVMFGKQEVVFTIDGSYNEIEIQGRKTYGEIYTVGVDFKF